MELAPQKADKTANSKIMVVASDPKFLKFIEMSLKLEFEYGIFSLTKGKRAIELSRHVKPDLFILDYHLPDLNAHDLSSQLHTISELECVPTIVLNSPVASWHMPQPYDTAFLSTQFALEELYSAVNKFLSSQW